MTIRGYHWGRYNVAFVLLGVLAIAIEWAIRPHTFDGMDMFGLLLIGYGFYPEKEIGAEAPKTQTH